MKFSSFSKVNPYVNLVEPIEEKKNEFVPFCKSINTHLAFLNRSITSKPIEFKRMCNSYSHK